MPIRLTRGKALIGAGAEHVILQTSFTHAAGTAASGVQVSYLGTVGTSAVLPGDWVKVSSNSVPGSATLYGSVQGAGTVHVTVQGPVSGTVVWAAGTAFIQVTRA